MPAEIERTISETTRSVAPQLGELDASDEGQALQGVILASRQLVGFHLYISKKWKYRQPDLEARKTRCEGDRCLLLIKRKNWE